MIRIESAAATHVGQVRDNNQDRALVAGQLAAVADGMGGHAGGDKAAELAVAELSGVRGTISDASLIKVVQAANKRIFRVALAPELRGMGTTVVACVVDNATALMSMANVGDSRGYQLRDGEFRQLTDDHSLVKDLLRSGRLTEQEARVHPQRNIVTRVLGISEDVDVDLFTIEVKVGDRYLLCSDGLTDEVEDADIAQLLGSAESVETAADDLVRAAVRNGGRDNVTVAIVEVFADEPVTTNSEASISTEEAEELERSLLAESEKTGLLGKGSDEAEQSRTDQASTDQASTDRAGQEAGIELATDGTQSASKRLAPLVVGTAAVVIAILGWLGSGWYANASFFATDDGGEVVILQGRPGGFLWHDPSVVQTTGLSVSELDGTSLEHLTSQPSWSSLTEAEDFVANLTQGSDSSAEG